MIIIDGNYFARRFFHLVQGQKEVNYLDMFRHLFLDNIINIKAKYGNKYGDVVVAKDKSSWRYEIYPLYKCSRKEKNKEDSIVEFYKVYDELLSLLQRCTNNKVIVNDRTEADDILYVLSTLDGNHLAYSGDKDIKQIIKENVDFYNFNEKTIIKADKERLEYELLKHILLGDNSDDIPNIVYNSETTKEFNDWILKKYNIVINENILYKMIVENSHLFEEYINEMNKKPFKNIRFGEKTVEKLIDSNSIQALINSNKIIKRNFLINRSLIDLTYVPLEIQNEILDIYKNYEYKLPNINELYVYCDLYKLNKVKEKINILVN